MIFRRMLEKRWTRKYGPYSDLSFLDQMSEWTAFVLLIPEPVYRLFHSHAKRQAALVEMRQTIDDIMAASDGNSRATEGTPAASSSPEMGPLAPRDPRARTDHQLRDTSF